MVGGPSYLGTIPFVGNVVRRIQDYFTGSGSAESIQIDGPRIVSEIKGMLR